GAALRLTLWLRRRCRCGSPGSFGCREWLRGFGRRAARPDLARLSQDFDAPTGLFDRLPRAVAESMRLDVQLALQAPGAEHLDVQARAHETRFEQRFTVDLGPIAEPAELGDVDDGVDLLERVPDSGLMGDALRARHLATLTAEAEAFAPGVLAFLTTPGLLAAT